MKLFGFLANRLAVVMVRICQMRMQTACKLKRPISFLACMLTSIYMVT
ncbi:hypothetical protein MCRH_1726 [Moraxella catarrhalis RH4]|nr:hypothetical protein MCR_1656 [Moraxella catarrhalis BBH18]EGE12520.1 hypothetical protein E9G_01068 [Moraxella catarrhalis 7169]EGE18508.1 hypothetical protein E9S_08649 [Moraxella catarrhalis BC7]EGE22313.1 hypothetical protein E9U_01061 [Moraxella catarrhalis BC8]EGE26164.1 hypothetical protein E9W_01330 [Moraxella catarrhalis CO72]EKF83124.1 hypothetical protein MCRH_1726 [Moraxella catarrhalis RH4]